MSNITKVVLSVLIIGFLLFVGIIYMILNETKKDVSKEEPYSKCLNIPIKLKTVATIRWYDKTLRFKPYSLVINEASNLNEESVKSVKVYHPGEVITFHAAKSYNSIHVGTTHYLIGRDTLANGKVIEFEYAYYGGVPPF